MVIKQQKITLVFGYWYISIYLASKKEEIYSPKAREGDQSYISSDIWTIIAYVTWDNSTKTDK